jgi:hypothetical protein
MTNVPLLYLNSSVPFYLFVVGMILVLVCLCNSDFHHLMSGLKEHQMLQVTKNSTSK